MFERTCIGVVLSLICAASVAGCAKKSADPAGAQRPRPARAPRPAPGSAPR